MSRGNGKGTRMGERGEKVMLVASLQVRQPLGQDSVISFNRDEALSVSEQRFLSLSLKSTTLKVFFFCFCGE